MKRVKYYELLEDSFAAKDSNGEVIYTKELEKADNKEKVGIMCSLIAEGQSLDSITKTYSWTLSKGAFKMLITGNPQLLQIYNTAKLTRLTFLEEDLIEYSREGDKDKIKGVIDVMKTLTPKEDKGKGVYNMTLWNAGKEEV